MLNGSISVWDCSGSFRGRDAGGEVSSQFSGPKFSGPKFSGANTDSLGAQSRESFRAGSNSAGAKSGFGVKTWGATSSLCSVPCACCMYHIEAHLLCKSSDGLPAGRGMLQFPQKTSSFPNWQPHTRQVVPEQLVVGAGSGIGCGDEGTSSRKAVRSARALETLAATFVTTPCACQC